MATIHLRPGDRVQWIDRPERTGTVERLLLVTNGWLVEVRWDRPFRRGASLWTYSIQRPQQLVRI